MKRKSVRASALAALVFVLAACEGRPPPRDIGEDPITEQQASQFLQEIEKRLAAGDAARLAELFTQDAIMSRQGFPDTVGRDAIRQVYEKNFAIDVSRAQIRTEEVRSFGDVAYVRGTYTTQITNKETGLMRAIDDMRHIHILRKDESGNWRAWRMMTNSGDFGRPPPPPLPPE